MKTKLFILSLSVLFSCEKPSGENYLEDDPKINNTEIITACGIENPQKNLPWLAELIEKADNDTTGYYNGTIWLEKYKEQDVFITDMMCIRGSLSYSFLDCQGNEMSFDDDEYTSNFFYNYKKDVTVYVSPGYEPVELVGKWISEEKDTINFLGYWAFVYEPVVPLTGVMRPYVYSCNIGKDSISAKLSYSSNSNDRKTYYFHYSKEQIEIRGFQNYEKGIYVRLK